jgi:hypothetical protein
LQREDQNVVQPMTSAPVLSAPMRPPKRAWRRRASRAVG